MTSFKRKRIFVIILFFSLVNQNILFGSPPNYSYLGSSFFNLQNFLFFKTNITKGILCTPPDISVAGANQTICVTSSATMAANTPTLGTGSWSIISGFGIITNSLSPTTDISSLTLGDNVFEWAITDGTCTSVSNVTITVNDVPDISNAGTNQTVCISSPNATLAANNPTLGIGTWSVISGGATIVSPNSPTSDLTAVALGTNVLQWTISNGGICPPTV
ncbi:MAG: hypothetical protein SFY56_11645, partial [Bacteroidota bacterium]|nr:hypothetical protein [Bacteroidota bacterium]